MGTLGINGYQGLLPERAMKENKTIEKNPIGQLFQICSTNEVQTDRAERGKDSAENITRNSLTNSETCFLIHTASVCPRVPMGTQQSRKLADVVFHVPAYFSPKVWLLTGSSFSCNRLVWFYFGKCSKDRCCKPSSWGLTVLSLGFLPRSLVSKRICGSRDWENQESRLLNGSSGLKVKLLGALRGCMLDVTLTHQQTQRATGATRGARWLLRVQQKKQAWLQVCVFPAEFCITLLLNYYSGLGIRSFSLQNIGRCCVLLFMRFSS